MDEEQKRNAIAKAMTDIEFHPILESADLTSQGTTRIPFTELAVAGSAAASLLEPFRTISQTVSSNGGETLYRAVFPEGITGTMTHFRGSSDYLGTIMNKEGIAGQVHWQEVAGSTSSISTTIPVDPMTLAIAVALAEVNQKLDAIQKTQQDMFEYLRQHDRANLKGDLKTLADILDNYKYNWDNETYKANKHNLTQNIKRSSDAAIEFNCDQIASILQKTAAVHFSKDVRDTTNEVRERLKDYQLSLYLYSFSSFLEVLLLGNFDHGYLEGVISKTEAYSIRYRELYTKCYDQIEDLADTSIQSHLLGGLSMLGKGAGGLVAKTPIGARTSIDEALIDAGEGASRLRKSSIDKNMQDIVETKSGVIKPFVDNIKTMDCLYNEPTEFLIGNDGLYLRGLDEGDLE